jgi:hypothetical protein
MTIRQQGGVFGRNPTFNSISFVPGSGGNIDSGTYTPVATGIDNCDAVTAYECMWLRVGNVVYVSGRVDVDATVSGDTRWSLTLPVPHDLTAIGDLAGVCAQRSSSIQYPGTIYAGVSSDAAEFRMYAGSTSNRETYFNFSYRF